LPLKAYDAEHAEQKESKQLGDPQEFQTSLEEVCSTTLTGSASSGESN
jgi:hypothetical protein